MLTRFDVLPIHGQNIVLGNPMTSYPIAKAKENLSKLVDETLAGEEVTISRHGKPVVELRPARTVGAGRWSPELIDEIAARAKSLPTLGETLLIWFGVCATSIRDNLRRYLGAHCFRL